MQHVVRVTFHDCPGSPVEEYTEWEANPECADQEPIEELLSYRPGATWSFRLDRVTSITDYYTWQLPCGTTQTITVALDGDVTLSAQENENGEQVMTGSGRATISATEEGCELSEDYQKQPRSSGPVSVPVEVSGTLHWSELLEPPYAIVSTTMLSNRAPATVAFEGELYTAADYLVTRERGWDSDRRRWRRWKDVLIPLAYPRYVQFLRAPLSPFSGSHSYLANEHPWPTPGLMMISLSLLEYGPQYRRFTDNFSIRIGR